MSTRFLVSRYRPNSLPQRIEPNRCKGYQTSILQLTQTNGEESSKKVCSRNGHNTYDMYIYTTRQPLRRGTGLQVVRTALKGAELSDVEDETVQRAAARTEMNK